MIKALQLSITILICGSLCSQTDIIGVKIEPDQTYTNLDANLGNYEIYRIDVKKQAISNLATSFQMNLILGDRSFPLNVYKGNLTASHDYADKPETLGGSLNSGGTVSLTINDDFIFGFIHNGANQYYIEPLRLMERGSPSDLFVFYNVNDVLEDGSHECGADLVASKTPKLPENVLKMPTTSCKIVDYAIANTFNMIAAHGSVTNVINFNTGVLNDVQTNYRSEFNSNLEYDLVATYVAASAAANPYEPQTTSTNGSLLLSRFRSWAQGPGNSGGGNSGGATGGFSVNYNMAGVWTDTDFSGGVVGIAYTPGWHHILENYTSSAASLKAMVSHEIGHNWSAAHDGSGTNFIMAPSVTITGNWSAASKSSVNSRVATQGYLSACSTAGIPVANFFQSAVAVCPGNTIEFEDQSQYGATRSWDFPSGSPSSSTSEKPVITYNTTGLHAVEITSTNGAGSDDFINYVDVQASPPTPCTPSGTGGSGGITGVTIANVNNPSGTTGVYEDFSCSDIATLDENTSYTLLVGVNGVSRLRYFADYNNDGDFTDPGEASSQWNFSGNGTLSFTLSTPTSPTTEELLRFRIIVSTTSITSTGCTTPSVGQVEDYSFYFDVPQVFGCTDPVASNYDPLATVDDGSCMYGTQTWYEDSDGDTYGNPNVSQQSGSQPPGYVLDNTDCDDTNANAYPGNTEVCDGVDNDCDGNVDEGVLNTYFRDMDDDDFGDANVTIQACSVPVGYTFNNTDCDDNDPLEFPGQVWFKDLDNDLHSDGIAIFQCTRPTNYKAASELISIDLDCDDNNPNAYPGNTEVCDGVDNDCDGDIDEGVMIMYFRDMDNDGFGDPMVYTQGCSQPPGYVLDNTDCDDNDPLEFPGQVWYKDFDGDLFGDGTTQSQCQRPANYYAAVELNGLDTDCNDSDPSINPDAAEVCGDGIDNNCDGNVDEGCGPPPDCDGTNLVINNITQNEYRADNEIDSDALADNGQSILFAAGNNIELDPGFEVEAGTEFLAEIAPCNNNFDSPTGEESGSILRIIDEESITTLQEYFAYKSNSKAKRAIQVYNRWGELLLEINLAKSSKLIFNRIKKNLPTGDYLLIDRLTDKSLSISLGN